MNANKIKPGRFFYLEWIFLNALSVIMAWYVTMGFISLVEYVVGDMIVVGGQSRITEDFLTMYVLLPTIGLFSGSIQFALLRCYLPRMAGWIAATFLGWLMPLVIGFFITMLFVLGNSAGEIVLGLLVLGTMIAVPQWWMLRKRVLHAWWWLLLFSLGWGMVGLLNLVTYEPFPILMGIAIIPAITTGFACWLLLYWYPIHELANLTSA